MRAVGNVSTSATTEVPVNATTYTEQTSGARRAMKSSSASDAAAGTGARKVKLTYYTLATDGTITGPFTETVTLNGTAAVATVAADIALVEKMEVMTAGSGGVPAGTLSLTAISDGSGATIASIAAAALQTFLGHHYVSSKKQCHLVDLEALGGDPAAALVQLKQTPYPGGLEKTITGPVGTTSTLPMTLPFADAAHAPIVGPAKVRATVTPANSNAQSTYVTFGFFDEVTTLP